MARKRKNYSAQFKAKAVLDLLEGDDSLSVVASRYGVAPCMLSSWRKQFIDNADDIFLKEKEIKERQRIEDEHERQVDNLNRIIGSLTVERDYLQKSCQDIIKQKPNKRSRLHY